MKPFRFGLPLFLFIVPLSWAFDAQNDATEKPLIDFHNAQQVRSRAPILIAHRGGVIGMDSPECSLSAIRLAAQHGYDMVELDIRRTQDGFPVVFHDNSLRNACGVDQTIDNLTLDEALQIRYRGTEKTICSLDQALAFCRSLHLGVMLDIKTYGDITYYRMIANQIVKHGLRHACITITGNPSARKGLQEVALLTVTREEIEALQENKKIDLRQRFWFGLPAQLPNDLIERLRNNGAYVIPAINTFRYPSDQHLELAEVDIQRLRRAGVDGFQIDSVYEKFFLVNNNQ